jgi:hypothetical protein
MRPGMTRAARTGAQIATKGTLLSISVREPEFLNFVLSYLRAVVSSSVGEIITISRKYEITKRKTDELTEAPGRARPCFSQVQNGLSHAHLPVVFTETTNSCEG